MTARRAPRTVLVYHPDEAPQYARLVKAPRGVDVRVASTAAEAARAVGSMDVLYAWNFPAGLYAKAPRLQWVQSMGAGADWALVSALPASVTVTRTPGVFGSWIGEYVVAWCLAVTQRMRTYLEAQRRQQWRADVSPQRLAGKTMVIVGLGDVGRAVARAARAAGVRVLGVSRSGRPAREADRVYRAHALASAVGAADFVVLTVPLTRETRGLVGPVTLAAMRPDAWLVNVARGPVVDEPALVDALRARRIGGAVLDVFTEEPLPTGHPLWTLDNVVVTPHIAGPDVPHEVTAVFNENLARWLAGRPLRHLVDRTRGY